MIIYVTIARKERGSEKWFVGSITDENERTLNISFDFLDEGVEHVAMIYKDGDNAHGDENPADIIIEENTLTKDSDLEIDLAAGGGQAISLILK